MKIIILNKINKKNELAIRNLIKSVGWNLEQENGQVNSLKVLSTSGTGIVIAMIENNKIIAYISGEYYSWNGLGQIQGLVVGPDFRHMKIATKLIDNIELFFRTEKKARGVFVDTPVDNNSGVGFYKSCGYSYGYLMPKYYSNKSDGVTYQKFW